MPEPRGQEFIMTVYVDCYIGGDFDTRISRTGFAIFINGAPIYWRSAKQQSFQLSPFGYEFTAIKQADYYVSGRIYKLQVMGILCDDPAFVYGDNKSVLSNTTFPDSTLKNKMNILCCHFVCEGCELDEWCTAYVNTNLNLADLIKKPLTSGDKRWGFVRRFYIVFNSNKAFMGSGIGQVPDTTPCIWFWGFQICYWVTFSQDENYLWGLV